jgi:DNA-binding transcriptional LysR family regulator
MQATPLSKRDDATMRKIDSTSARIFVAIIEEGSIGKAAKREHIVPSAVSKRLAELESHLGVALVERSQQGVTPTPAGEALVHHARIVLQAFDRMHEEMSEYVDGVRGHIRVRASASSLSAGLPSEIQSFMRSFKRVKIDLEEVATPLVVRDIAESRADVGIAPNILGNESLQLFPYKSYDLSVAVPSRHPLARLKRVAYQQILKYEQVELSQGSALSQRLDYAAHQSMITKHTRVRVRGFEAVCQMIGYGMGIGVVPSFLEASYSKMYGLKFIPLSDEWAHPLICIMVRDLEGLPSAAKAFVEHLRQAASAK